MKVTFSIALLCTCLSPMLAMAESYTSKYVGEEHRQIKSLSAEDIQELRNGAGWGLAKAAELNGYPGPAHLLEMSTEIKLTKEQTDQIQKLYAAMKSEAIELGSQLIEREKELNQAFVDETITQARLETLVKEIETLRSDLRVVHLSTHLQTPEILTAKQINQYNQLRGYANDPCQNIPKGHNVAMWKKHNGCE